MQRARLRSGRAARGAGGWRRGGRCAKRASSIPRPGRRPPDENESLGAEDGQLVRREAHSLKLEAAVARAGLRARQD